MLNKKLLLNLKNKSINNEFKIYIENNHSKDIYLNSSECEFEYVNYVISHIDNLIIYTDKNMIAAESKLSIKSTCTDPVVGPYAYIYDTTIPDTPTLIDSIIYGNILDGDRNHTVDIYLNNYINYDKILIRLTDDILTPDPGVGPK